MDADIRVWVLTGDKQETAIEIGKTSKLLQPGFDLVILSSSKKEKFYYLLDRYCMEYVI